MSRSIATQGGSEFEIHGFSDASKKLVCAAIYTVEYQGYGRVSVTVNQSLLVAKSRVAPKDTSILKLELIAAMTLVKLPSNVLRALKVQPIRSVHNWVDGVTVLYWLANKGTWSAFVRNRVEKIKELGDAEWFFVPTGNNPSDLGTRGRSTSFPLPVTFLEEDVEVINEKAAVTKRMRYLKVCREHLKKRWLTEHVHALEERQRKVFNDVLITDYSKIKSKWRNGRTVEVIRARDRVVRGHKIKTGTG